MGLDKLRRCAIGAASLALAVVVAAWLLRGEVEPASGLNATPHTISYVDHPYDPDWPDVYLILTNKCIGCHRKNNDQDLGDLSTYEAIIACRDYDDEPVVKPGRADDSALYNMVAWNVHAVRDSKLPGEPDMPPERHEWLTAGQLATLKRWINNGALRYKLPDHCSPAPLMEQDFPSGSV